MNTDVCKPAGGNGNFDKFPGYNTLQITLTPSAADVYILVSRHVIHSVWVWNNSVEGVHSAQHEVKRPHNENTNWLVNSAFTGWQRQKINK